MTRTYEPDRILAALIEEYQKCEHFIIHNEGKIYARMTATEDEQGPIPFHGKIDFCLTDMAANLAERLSK